MRVSELVEFLSNCEPDAEVVIFKSRIAPMECAVERVLLRGDLLDRIPPDRHDALIASGSPDDVILATGPHRRYAEKAAWRDT